MQRLWRRGLPHLHQRLAHLGPGRQRHRHPAGQRHQPARAAGPETFNFNRVLPNAGFTLSPFGPMHQFYMDFASSLAAPRTDNLYNGGNNGLCVTTAANQCAGLRLFQLRECAAGNLDQLRHRLPLYLRHGDRLADGSTTPSSRTASSPASTRIRASDRPQYRLGERGGRGCGSQCPAHAGAFRLHLGVLRTQPGQRRPACHHPVERHAARRSIWRASSWWKRPEWTISQRYEYKLAGWTFGFGGKFSAAALPPTITTTRYPAISWRMPTSPMTWARSAGRTPISR